LNIAQLFARIGIKTDEGKLKSFNSALNTAKVGMFAAVGIATGFAVALKKITDEAFAAASALKLFEYETGASAQQMQVWQQIGKQVNVSAESITSGIKSITDNQAKLRLGMGDISGYQLLGIDPMSDPFEILENLRKKTEGLNQSMKKQVLSQMGLSSDFIRILDLTNEEFDRLASNTFVFSPQAIASMDRARGSMQAVGNMIRWLKGMLAAELAPQIEDVTKKIILWVKQNKDGIIKTVKDAAYWIMKFGSAIFRAGKFVNEIVNNTIGWKNAILGLITVFIVLNTVLASSPIGLIVAGIVLLVAVLEDLYVYSKGGKSLFGLMMEQFPEMEAAVMEFVHAVEGAMAILSGVIKDTMDVGEIIDEWGRFAGIVATVAEMFKFIQDIDFSNTLNIFDWFFRLFEDFSDLFQDWGGEGKNLFLKSVVGGSFYGKGMEGRRNYITQNFRVNIDVDGKRPSKEQAEIIGKEVEKAVSRAQAQIRQWE
jgi:hypothetical protein